MLIGCWRTRPDIPVISIAGATLRGSDPATPSPQGAVDGDALAHQIRREIAAYRQMVQNTASCHSDQRPPRRE
jgi:hypothetical protein